LSVVNARLNLLDKLGAILKYESSEMVKAVKILALLCILISCSKDKAIAPLPQGDCPNYDDLPYNPGQQIINGDSVSNVTACFNPNNPNEFAYYHGNNLINKGEIRIFNLQTKTYSVVYSRTIWTRPVWGSSYWIAFGLNQQLFKIKRTGDSLTQLSTHGENYYPVWSPNAQEMVFVFRNTENKQFVMLSDNKGTHLDSIPDYWFGDGGWNAGNQIAFLPTSDSKSIGLIDANQFLIRLQLQVSSIRISDVKWIPNTDDILWTCRDGIFRTNTKTQQTMQIKSGCDFKNYDEISVSNDGQRILASVFTQKYLDPDTIAIFSEIRIMNIDGSEEQIVQFPN